MEILRYITPWQVFSYLEEEGKFKKKIKKGCFGLKYGGNAGALMGQGVVHQNWQASDSSQVCKVCDEK